MIARGPGSRPRRLRTLVNVAVSTALLALLAWLVDLGSMARILVSASPLLVAAAVLAAFADRALIIAKWLPLLWAQDVEVPPLRAARVYLATAFAQFFLPSSAGSDVLRAVALGRRQNRIVEIGASIVMERLLGLAAAGVLAAVALAVGLTTSVPLSFLVPWALAAIAAAAAAICLPLAPRLSFPLRRWLESCADSRWAGIALKFGAAYELYRHRLPQLALVGALSVAEHCFPILVFWILGHALGIAVSPIALIVATPLALFVGRLPVAVAGIGVLEGALVVLLGLFGVPAAAAASLGVAGRVVEIVAALPGALFWADVARELAPGQPAQGPDR